MPHNTLFIKVSQTPANPKLARTKVGLLVRYDGVGISGPVELGGEQVLTTLDIDGWSLPIPMAPRPSGRRRIRAGA